VLAQACVEMGTNRRHAGCRSEAEDWAVRAVGLSSQSRSIAATSSWRSSSWGMVDMPVRFRLHFKQGAASARGGDTDLRARWTTALPDRRGNGRMPSGYREASDCLEQYAELPDTYGVARANADSDVPPLRGESRRR